MSCCSSSTGTPSSRAFASFEPASLPATTKLVFFDTLPDTLAPRAVSASCACSRLMLPSVPVMTTVRPESAGGPAVAAARSISGHFTPLSRKALITLRCSSDAKNAARCAATTGPTSGTWRIALSSAPISGSSVPKCRASASAVASPTSRMPSPYSSRGVGEATALALAGEPAGTTRHRLALHAQHLRAAHRTGLRQLHARGILRALVQDDADHFGDYIAGTAHHHGVADPHVLALHLVDVVQGDVAHRHAAHEHGCQARYRGERPGAPDLKLDSLHDGERLVGGKLVGDRPAWGPRQESEALLVGAPVELVDHAVDLIGEWAAPLAHLAIVREASRDPAHR